jgi:hypothetical protein
VAAVGCKTLTGGVRLSARAGDGAAEWIWWAGAGPIGEAGRAAAVVWVSFFFFSFFFFKSKSLFPNQINFKQTPNSNRDLNPATKNNAPACMQQ